MNDLGLTLYCHLTINDYFSTIAQMHYFCLHCLTFTCRFLTNTATTTDVSAFALTRIYYCNLLLHGFAHDVTSHFQWIQNYAAQVSLCNPRSANMSIHVRSLNCLPVKGRSTYKITCLYYHCHNITVPLYVTDALLMNIRLWHNSLCLVPLFKRPLHFINIFSRSHSMPLFYGSAHSKTTNYAPLFSPFPLPLLDIPDFGVMAAISTKRIRWTYEDCL